MATPFTHEDEPGRGAQHAAETRLHVEEEQELERRTKATYRAAERGGMQWPRRSPNQRFVAHRRGNR